jgi:hypothetical protein
MYKEKRFIVLTILEVQEHSTSIYSALVRVF